MRKVERKKKEKEKKRVLRESETWLG